MKLYAESQVKDMLSCVMHEHHIDIFLEENYTPIELPTDEDITNHFTTSVSPKIINTGGIEGAKWVIEQIKKQTK